MSHADGDFPALFQLIRPGLRRGETRDYAVSIGSAPSRPILRAGELKREDRKNEN
jgi:hypothetical protein